MSRAAFVFATLFAIGPLTALLAAACGDSAVGGPSPGGTDTADGATPDASSGDAPAVVGTYAPATAGVGKSYCDETAGAITSTLLGPSCCSAADRTSGQYGLLAGLIAGLTQECETALEASIAKGRITYNAAAANACYAEVQTILGAGCAGTTSVVVPDQGASCHGVFAGNVAVAGACINDYECADGLTCVGYATPLPASAPPIEGSCQNPPAIDQPCAQIRPDGSVGSTTISFKFGTHPACAPGAYCTASAGGKCAALRNAGQTCSETTDCADGLTCVNGKCDAAGPSDVGGSCTVASDCKKGLYCERPPGGSGTCQERKPASSPCTGGALSSECKGRCDAPDGSATGTCVSFCGSQ